MAYGPLVVLGTYFVQAGAINSVLLHLSCILGLLVAAFLWINQFPDYRADRASGKRNLVVRLGTSSATQAYVMILTTAYAWLVLLLVTEPAARAAWPGLLGAIPALLSARRLSRYTGTVAELVPAQAAALLSFCLMATGAGLGYLLLG